MNSYIVKTNGEVNTLVHLSLISYGNPEKVSDVFSLYKVITDKNIDDVTKIQGVLEVKEEGASYLNDEEPKFDYMNFYKEIRKWKDFIEDDLKEDKYNMNLLCVNEVLNTVIEQVYENTNDEDAWEFYNKNNGGLNG